MAGTSINSKNIPSARAKVYHAFIDRKALEFWLAPNDSSMVETGIAAMKSE